MVLNIHNPTRDTQPDKDAHNRLRISEIMLNFVHCSLLADTWPVSVYLMESHINITGE